MNYSYIQRKVSKVFNMSSLETRFGWRITEKKSRCFLRWNARKEEENEISLPLFNLPSPISSPVSIHSIKEFATLETSSLTAKLPVRLNQSLLRWVDSAFYIATSKEACQKSWPSVRFCIPLSQAIDFISREQIKIYLK